MSEKARRMAALCGLVLWMIFPFIYAAGTHARWEHRCSGRTYQGSFDDCFNDALPMFELVAFPLTIGLAYPFARFAFSMFGPQAAARSRRWRLAASGAGEAYFPNFQILAAFGVVWSSLHLASVPLSARYWYLTAYWLTWILWFLFGAYASYPVKGRSPTNSS